MCFGIPRPLGYLISAVVIIPLVTYGITLISRFQLWTQPLWIMLQIVPFVAIAWANPHSVPAVDAIRRRSTATPPAISICCCSAPPPRWCSR